MICIIPARGGSKRLPGKNLLKLDGEYIINRVIQIAKESELFTDIIVSTDSEEIADIVKGAIVSMRPEQISGDIAEDKVLKWTAYKYDAQEFCRIYPFAVLLTPERLKAAYNQYIWNGYDAILECQKFSHPPERRFSLKDGYKQPSIISLPTESIEETFHDAGTFMFTQVKALRKPLAERDIKWIPIEAYEAQDVDNWCDWDMLIMKWNYMKIDKRPIS
jgi:N-acylneuraminate cytidylyltransferase